jgi:hypothetical protein
MLISACTSGFKLQSASVSRIACSSRAMRVVASLIECRYSWNPICWAACCILSVASQRMCAAVQALLPA